MKSLTKRYLSLLVLLSLFLSIFASFPASASYWEFEKIDKTGLSHTMSIDERGFPHIAYFKWHSNPEDLLNSRAELKYIYWTGSSWEKTTVDVVGIFGSIISLKLDDRGNPHIAYSNISISEKMINRTTYFYTCIEEVKYAAFIDGKWKIETIDRVNKTGYFWDGGPPFTSAPEPSLVLDKKGNPHISYELLTPGREDYKMWNMVLKYAEKSNDSWHIENITEKTVLGFYINLDEENRPYIIETTYIPNSKFTDSHTYEKAIYMRTEGGWSYEKICRWNLTNVSFYSYKKGIPKYLSLGMWGKPLRYLEWNGDEYEVHTVSPKVYWFSSIVTDESGTPHVAYLDSKGLEYATLKGDEWVVDNVLLTEKNILGIVLRIYNTYNIYILYRDQYDYLWLATARSLPPTNLTATLSDSNVTLTWNPPMDDGNATVTEYRIYRGTSPDSLELIASVNGSVTRYIDTNVTKGETYYYSVSAVNSIGESNLSDVVSIEIPKEETQPQPTPSLSFVWIIGAIGLIVLLHGKGKRKLRRT